MYRYTFIKYGDDSPAVREYQERLIELGYDKCLVGGKVKTLTADGKYGDITCAVTENLLAKLVDVISVEWVKQKFPAAEDWWFEINGKLVTPALGAFLERVEELSAWYKQKLPEITVEVPKEETGEPLWKKLGRMVVELAKGEVGVKEKGTTNTGKRVNEYQDIGSCGEVKNGGSPWCSYYVKWLFRTILKLLGMKDLFECGGYTPYDRQWGIKKGIAVKYPDWDDMVFPFIFFIYGASRGDVVHTGIGIARSGNNIVTNEGNTNAAGSSNGGEVANRLRDKSQMYYINNVMNLYK
jgi:hypothetical protein